MEAMPVPLETRVETVVVLITSSVAVVLVTSTGVEFITSIVTPTDASSVGLGTGTGVSLVVALVTPSDADLDGTGGGCLLGNFLCNLGLSDPGVTIHLICSRPALGDAEHPLCGGVGGVTERFGMAPVPMAIRRSRLLGLGICSSSWL